MKTTWNVLKTGSRLPLLMAVMALTLMGCPNYDDVTYPERPQESEPAYNGNIMSQSFKVLPEGTEVSLLDGTVWMQFPEGTVSEPTEFRVTSFPIQHLDLKGFNMYNRGIYLEGETPYQYTANVQIRIKYDLAQESWKKSAPGPEAEKELTIYFISPNILAYQRINSIGTCCVDCSCKMIRGCISCCGTYVVGEN
jgi:hypothetical protein